MCQSFGGGSASGGGGGGGGSSYTPPARPTFTIPREMIAVSLDVGQYGATVVLKPGQYELRRIEPK